MKSQSFISKIDILVHWEDRHYGSQYRRSLFVMEKSGCVLLLLYFSCCSVSVDIFRLQSRSAGCAALLEVGEVACVCVCTCVCVCVVVGLKIRLAIPLHQTQQICPVVTGSHCQGWAGPLVG